jgi:ATP-dependent DNA helicase RecG
MGTRQTGAVHFKIADLARDADLLEVIQQTGEQLFTESPHAIQPLCDRWLGTSTDYAEV